MTPKTMTTKCLFSKESFIIAVVKNVAECNPGGLFTFPVTVPIFSGHENTGHKSPSWVTRTEGDGGG